MPEVGPPDHAGSSRPDSCTPRLRPLGPLLLLLALVYQVAASAQTSAPSPTPQPPGTVDLSNLGDRVQLGPIWLIHPGDNPAWASPTLDDHDWTPVDITKPAPPQLNGSPVYWYRLHANLRPGLHDLALVTYLLSEPRDLFVNGTPIAHFGNIGQHDEVPSYYWVASDIPNQALQQTPGREASNLLIAIRASGDPRQLTPQPALTHFPPLRSFTKLYLQTQRSARQDLSYAFAHDLAPQAVDLILILLVFLVSAAIALALPNQLEYQAISFELLAWTLSILCGSVLVTSKLTADVSSTLQQIFASIGSIALIEFVRLILGRERTRPFLVAMAMTIGNLITAEMGLYFGKQGRIHLEVLLDQGEFLSSLVVFAILFGVLVRPAFRGNLDARLLLPALVLNAFGAIEVLVGWIPFLLHRSDRMIPEPRLHLGTYEFNLESLVSYLFTLTILLFLVLRTLRLARERARIGAELQAARTTQELLLARSRQPTPGFLVETIYHPAAEVGGDFFLVSPAPDGSLTAIVGDVSGKGLVAALRVSMILGVLHRANQGEDDRDPAAILAHLNQALLSGGDLGFTTACCIHLHPGGQLQVSNAGHISPYLAGNELPTDSALPLGLAPDQTYPTTTATLSPGQTLVLLSDGVVEARSPKGELFGFDRVAALTRLPAADIADTAQRFGQEDDITVLTIARA